MNDKVGLRFDVLSFHTSKNFEKCFIQEKKIIRNIQGIEKTKLRYYNNSEFCNIDVNANGCRVVLNPNKIAKNEPANKLSFEKFCESVKKVEKYLNSVGIECKINDGKFIRYDNSYDITPQKVYKEYEPVIKSLSPLGIRQAKTKIYENTLYFGNKTDVIVIYDKQVESGLKYPCIRFEIRHLKAKNKNLFLKDINEKKYYSLRSEDKNKIQESIFKKIPEIINDEFSRFVYDLYTNKDGLKTPEIAKRTLNYAMKKINGFDNDKLKRSLEVSRSNDKIYQRNSRLFKSASKELCLSDTKLVNRYDEMKDMFLKVEL